MSESKSIKGTDDSELVDTLSNLRKMRGQLKTVADTRILKWVLQQIFLDKMSRSDETVHAHPLLKS
jgi:hypothetical protein